MAFSDFFRSEISTILIKIKVLRLELARVQTDIERLLLLDQDSTTQEAQQLIKLEEKFAKAQEKKERKNNEDS